MANVSPEVVLGISFLTLNGADVDFLDQKLWKKTYTTVKTLSTTRRIKLVGKKKFAAVALDLESETFVIHIASLNSNMLPNSSLLRLNIHPIYRHQVSG